MQTPRSLRLRAALAAGSAARAAARLSGRGGDGAHARGLAIIRAEPSAIALLARHRTELIFECGDFAFHRLAIAGGGGDGGGNQEQRGREELFHGDKMEVAAGGGELLGEPVRITDVSPGAVETEFSIVRFDGDTEKAAKVYDGFTPLTADDVAEVITFAVTRPKWVNLDRIVMKPIAQATTMRFDRTGRY